MPGKEYVNESSCCAVTGWQQLLHAVMADCPVRAARGHMYACTWAVEEGSGKEQERPVHTETGWEDTPVSVVVPHTTSTVHMFSTCVCVGVCFEHLCVLQMNILVDTGSSNFAVAAAPHPFITHFFNTAL